MAAPLNTNIKKIILDTTYGLLESSSFAALSLGRIAESCGISKGTLYYYYKTKEDLIFDLACVYLDELHGKLIAWADDTNKDTSLPRLVNYVLEYGIFNEAGAMRLYLIGAAVSGYESVRKKLTEKYRYFKDTLAERLRERGKGEDSAYAAWLLLVLMDGLLVQSQLGNDDLDVNAFIKKTVSVLSAKV